MTKDVLRYDRMVENALRSVVREALSHASEHGLPGGHHFYVTFKTGAPGVDIPDHLHAKFPDQMTVVLEHQFWDLAVAPEAFAVTLSFNNRPERLTIPWAAITAFADPSVKFGLQFQGTAASAPSPAEDERRLRLTEKADGAKPKSAPKLVETKPAEGKPGEKKPGEVVTLDTFRKK